KMLWQSGLLDVGKRDLLVIGNEQRQFVPDQFTRRISKHAFGGFVGKDDVAFVIDGDQYIERRIRQDAVSRFALAQVFFGAVAFHEQADLRADDLEHFLAI